jgi:hypothetical protein
MEENKMTTKKDRRHSGRETTNVYHPNILPYEETKYDEWRNYRDGFRSHRDRTKILDIKTCKCGYCEFRRKNKINQKLKRKIKRFK